MKTLGILFLVNLLIDIIGVLFWLFFKFKSESVKKQKLIELIESLNDIAKYILIIYFILFAL